MFTIGEFVIQMQSPTPIVSHDPKLVFGPISIQINKIMGGGGPNEFQLLDGNDCPIKKVNHIAPV